MITTITTTLRTNERVKMFFLKIGNDLVLKKIFSYDRNTLLSEKEIENIRMRYDKAFNSNIAIDC